MVKAKSKSSTKKIAIIGAGWFGCYIGYDLIKSGYEVKIFEKEIGSDFRLFFQKQSFLIS